MKKRRARDGNANPTASDFYVEAEYSDSIFRTALGDREGALSRLECGFRGKAGMIPGSIRSAFRNESGHDSGMNPVTDSDIKPVNLGRLSES
jgi:hypothetical protein